MKHLIVMAVILAGVAPGVTTSWADDDRFITVASTTSTENSGLLADILPRFTADTGIEVRVIALGTGQAIRVARNGDADVLLVHHTASEEQFVADGFGVERYQVMHNDFVIVGPASDPAGIGEMANAGAALARIAEKKAVFASRGDDSGTHKKELLLWQAAEINPAEASGTGTGK
ncbi:MAG: substrate-binding domain-containing protein, partial [Chromatiales bacterium]|nr:substrate-binding domain-containing protein [Chromatiales bacterium]